MSNYTVEFFEKENGEVPVEKFIYSLGNKLEAKFYRLLDMLAKNGPDLREPYSKYINDGIFELRPRVGNDIARALYFFYDGKRIIVTNGFIKKTQKTPIKEIEIAKKYRNEYLRREEKK